MKIYATNIYPSADLVLHITPDIPAYHAPWEHITAKRPRKGRKMFHVKHFSFLVVFLLFSRFFGKKITPLGVLYQYIFM